MSAFSSSRERFFRRRGKCSGNKARLWSLRKSRDLSNPFLRAKSPYAASIDSPPTIAVTGSAIAQKSDWSVFMLRTSEVFIPKTEATNDRGRKIMVTRVNMKMAFELPSSMTSILCRSACVFLSISFRRFEMSSRLLKNFFKTFHLFTLIRKDLKLVDYGLTFESWNSFMFSFKCKKILKVFTCCEYTEATISTSSSRR